MTTREALAPEFEAELADAVDRILAAIGDGGCLEEGGPDTVRTVLDAYLDQQSRLAVAAQRHAHPGLRTACDYMAANLTDLLGRNTALRPEECALLLEWPSMLIEYCADPGSVDAAAGLVATLSNGAWSARLTVAQADELRGMFMSPATEGAGATVAHQEAAAACDEATAGPGVPANDPSAGCVESNGTAGAAEGFLADGSFTKIPYSTRVSWMADLASRKGMVGILEVCERVGQAVQHWEHEQTGMSRPRCERLDGVLGVVKDALTDRYDQELAEQLLAMLSEPLWPEPLGGDDRELVSDLLRVDMATCEPSEPSRTDDCLPECGVGESVPSASDQARPEGAGDDWTHEQPVTAELVQLLATELEGARKSLQNALQAASSGDDATVADAVAQYADEIERIGTAAGSIGLFALCRYLAELRRLFGERATTRVGPQQYEVLEFLPRALTAYLAAPDDASAAEGLVDILRSGVWAAPMSRLSAAQLTQGLCRVRVSHESASVPERPQEARPEDVSLAFPEDINQELLEGLLQELPLQTGAFSTAVQQIAGGQGSLDDVDTAKRAAHTLKGAANTVGVRGIANLTHHLEDILIALSTEGSMPSRSLADTLIRAADCLECMSEAVAGAGPEPEDGLAILQDVLNWANRIDREGVPGSEDAPDAVGKTAGVAPAKTPAVPGLGGPMVRVPAALIDELLRLVGETIISTGQIRDRLDKVARHHEIIRDHVGNFLRLTSELEELVDLGGGADTAVVGGDRAEFDPLEFERYSELHTVSRRLIESATDAREMGVGMEAEVAELREFAEAQERLHHQTQTVIMQTRMVPVSTVVSRLQRGVRQVCRLVDKQAILEVKGAETLIDSNILNDLVDPLMHVLRNAADHGIEPESHRIAAGKPGAGLIELSFAREGNQVVVRCRDDGAGLDLAAIRRTAQEKGLIGPNQTVPDDELFRLILAPGFSTREEATQVSGRGIGLDILRNRIQQMKGSLNLHSEPGKGLSIELRLPAALISTHALIVRSRDKRLAVSSHGVHDIHYVTPAQIQVVAGASTYRIGDIQLQLVELEALLGLPGDRRVDPRGGFPVLLVRLDNGGLRAVRAQEVLQSRDLVVKALGRYVPRLRGVVGVTILGDGSVAPVIDLPEMMAAPMQMVRGISSVDPEAMREDYERGTSPRATALIVDDSLSARRATSQFMKDAGFEVRTAIDGLEAVSILATWTPDVMLVDIEMPRMSGLELTSHVRASRQLRNIIVMLFL